MIRAISKNAVVATLAFLHGAILMALAVLLFNADYEDRLYDTMTGILDTENMNEEDTAVALMGLSHALVWPRTEFFSRAPYIPGRGMLFRSGDMQLVDGRDGCGAFSHVLGRLLQQAGYEFRIVQMACDVAPICHILVEARAGGKWIVLDPLYNLAFRNRDGSYASADEISEDWAWFGAQVPPGYDPLFRYQAWQYTNWDKIPVVMPAVKWILDRIPGLNADGISLRALVLNLYRTYAYAALFAWILLVAATVWLFRARRRRASGAPESDRRPPRPSSRAEVGRSPPR